MDVCLARLDVVVEVVAEGLDVRDDLLAARGGEVAGEEDWDLVSIVKFEDVGEIGGSDALPNVT